MTAITAGLIFLGGYLINIFYITVLYHRGLAHGSVTLRPWTRCWVATTGSWVTGIDPKAWACMHRLHHQFSDTPRDPHSPVHLGIFGVMRGQLRSYERTLSGLIHQRPEYTRVVKDLDFPVHWLNCRRLWWLPYAIHFVIAALVALATATATAGKGSGLQGSLFGAAYLFGIMSHPIQGWMVNSLAHRFGYCNHASGDHSRNNSLVAWLVMGEGYQNNHHASPDSPKFSERWFEVDVGYALCLLAARAGWLSIHDRGVNPDPTPVRSPDWIVTN